MHQEHCRQWIRALRSGKYAQGRLMLITTEGKYCCLGVGCEEALKNGAEVNQTLMGDVYAYNSRTAYMPNTISKYYDIDEFFQKTLTDLNDIKLKTFNEIADFIEAELNR